MSKNTLLRDLRERLGKLTANSVATTKASDEPSSVIQDLHALPILRASALLERFGIAATLDAWRTLAGLDDSVFNALIQDPFYRYAEAVQMAPASESHHHAGPGGLLLHTYDVITLALQKRRGLQLPIGGTLEQIGKQRHLWTYAVFAGCLLHDIGKLMSSIRITAKTKTGDERPWSPQDVPLPEQKDVVSYRIEFVKTPYSYHAQVALCNFDLLPQNGRAWLARNTLIMMQLCAHLRGDRYESGALGEIVESADMTSTAMNLKKPIPQRFSHAPSVIERFIHIIRHWIAEGDIKLNVNGGMGWVGKDGYVYIVCRTLANKLIGYCDDMAITDLPRDPVRIYDILQEHDLAQSTPDNKAIWNMKISSLDPEYTHYLTCLKFEMRRLCVPTRIPAAFKGEIEVVEAGTATKKASPPTTGKPSEDAANTPTETQETASTQDAESNGGQAKTQEAAPKGAEEKTQKSAPLGAAEKTPEAEANPALAILKAAANKRRGKNTQESAPKGAEEKTLEPAPKGAEEKIQAPETHTQEAAKQQDAAKKSPPAPAQRDNNTADTEVSSEDAEETTIEETAPVFRDDIEEPAPYRAPDEKTQEPAPKGAEETPEAAQKAQEDEKNSLAAKNQTHEAGEDVEKPKEAAKKYSRYTVSGEPLPEKLTMENKQLAHFFIPWLRANMKNKTMAMSAPGAQIHFVEAGVFLVAPAIMKSFLSVHGMDGEVHHATFSKRFARLHIHIKCPPLGINVHQYFTVNSKGTTTKPLTGWIVPYSLFFDAGETLPTPNPHLKKTVTLGQK